MKCRVNFVSWKRMVLGLMIREVPFFGMMIVDPEAANSIKKHQFKRKREYTNRNKDNSLR